MKKIKSISHFSQQIKYLPKSTFLYTQNRRFLSIESLYQKLSTKSFLNRAKFKKTAFRPFRAGRQRFSLIQCSGSVPSQLQLFSCLRQLINGFLQILIGWDIITHNSIIKLLISHHIEVSGSGQTEYDVLYLSGLLAL